MQKLYQLSFGYSKGGLTVVCMIYTIIIMLSFDRFRHSAEAFFGCLTQFIINIEIDNKICNISMTSR